jgi:hypothetical protein
VILPLGLLYAGQNTTLHIERRERNDPGFNRTFVSFEKKKDKSWIRIRTLFCMRHSISFEKKEINHGYAF